MKLYVGEIDKAWSISKEQVKKYKIQAGALSPMLGKRIVTDEAGRVAMQDTDLCEVEE